MTNTIPFNIKSLFSTIYYKGLLMKCISKREKGRVHSLCLPFLLSICLTGVSYSFFTLYVILYFLTLYNIQKNIESKKDHNTKNSTIYKFFQNDTFIPQ